MLGPFAFSKTHDVQAGLDELGVGLFALDSSFVVQRQGASAGPCGLFNPAGSG